MEDKSLWHLSIYPSIIYSTKLSHQGFIYDTVTGGYTGIFLS